MSIGNRTKLLFAVAALMATIVFVLLAAPASKTQAQSGPIADERGASAADAQTQDPMIQVGPWYPAPFNFEEPYINIIHASQVRWNADGLTTQQLYDQGYIDKATGLPTRVPGGTSLKSGVYFVGGEDIRPHWDGEWVLEWEGEADITLQHHADYLQKRVSKNRIEFTRDYVGGRTPWHVTIRIKRMKEPMRALRMFRKENEAALRAGKIYNPKFTAAVSRYDIVRTMDLQEINRAVVRSVDDLPGEGAPFWGNHAWQSVDNVRHTYQSMPLHAVFALAMETSTQLWTHAPMMLGMPVDLFDASMLPDFENNSLAQANSDWAGAYSDYARDHAAEILASPEWDRYADHFVAALIESGYPADRPLYITVANEVWNFSLQYFLTTLYASGISEALSGDMGLADNQLRYGYGILTARWKLALDAALIRAGRQQDVTYVVEGQAAWDKTSEWALSAAQSYLEEKGERWNDHAPGFGLSIASYWGHSENFDAINSKAGGSEMLSALERFLLNGPANSVGTKNQVVEAFKAHASVGERFGVRFIGAYEGGSHLTRPSDVSKDLYQAFMWGEPAARINTAVNDALAEEIPGVILSNYVLAGPIGSPWLEGPIGAQNPYARSWERYLRPETP